MFGGKVKLCFYMYICMTVFDNVKYKFCETHFVVVALYLFITTVVQKSHIVLPKVLSESEHLFPQHQICEAYYLYEIILCVNMN